MEEFAYRAIERVGFPIAVSVVSFWAVYKLFLMREADRATKNDRLAVATDVNTTAITELSATLKSNMSDGQLCRYNPAGVAAAVAIAAVEATAAIEKRHNERNIEQAKQFKKDLEELQSKLQPVPVTIVEQKVPVPVTDINPPSSKPERGAP